jgi:GalNAc-alpha-(1->4)-GalNAc-alpha-(1->3)-diNAcBac-PP-undecaprenol alpha-1,4-N-acetyl-D-galactosaminyltransferase
MRITFVSACLECGGAERALVTLIVGLRRAGHEVAVITLSSAAKDFYSLPRDVERIALDMIPAVRGKNSVTRLLAGCRRLRALRRTIPATRPDVVVSSLQHINVMTLLALTGNAIPTVVVEHNDVTLSCGEPWNLLRRITYSKAAKVVSVSHGVDKGFKWLPQAKRAVIHNPLTPDYTRVADARVGIDVSSPRKYLVGMGRLTYLKGFDLLVSAFANLADRFSDWDLIIIGDGGLRCELEELRDRLGLAQRVQLTGQLHHPFSLLKQADLFALPSRSEGFPNVLIEAMACGLPVIAADCASGPSELVRDGENGLLVPAGDLKALEDGLERLMGDAAERARLAGKPAAVEELYGIDKITEAWEKLLHQLTADKRPTQVENVAGLQFSQTNSDR